MESVKDTASWAALIGAMLPLLIAVVNRPQWTAQMKQIIGIAVAAIGGIGTVLASGNFDAQNWLVTLVAVIGASQAAYALIWKPTKVAPKIEQATSAKPGEEGAVSTDLLLGIVIGAVGLLLILLLSDNVRF